jgi:hypothetical protein
MHVQMTARKQPLCRLGEHAIRTGIDDEEVAAGAEPRRGQRFG